MRLRRAFLWVMIASIIVLPAWVMFGRGIFGAPLGSTLLGQAFLMPGLAILIGIVVALTYARKEVRGPRAATANELRTIGPWLLSILLLGLTVIDSNGTREGSVLTQWLGAGWLTASASFQAILSIVVIVGGVWLAWRATQLLGLETKARVTSFVEQVNQQAPTTLDASFERQSGPQSGATIRLEGPKP